MTYLLAISLAFLLTLILLIIFLPRKLQYIESIRINDSRQKVYDAIRFQEQLMTWTVWPQETNSSCSVENTDGQVGARTIYLNKKGKKFGYQEVINLEEAKRVEFFLKSFVAPFEEQVTLTFLLYECAENETEVILWFNETMKKPLFLIAYLGGIIRWVRFMHIKDLKSLKEYVEAQ